MDIKTKLRFIWSLMKSQCRMRFIFTSSTKNDVQRLDRTGSWNAHGILDPESLQPHKMLIFNLASL